MTTREAAPTHRSISAVALIAVLMVGVATPSAVATTTYRYWSYWIVDAGTSPEWGYAPEGAGTRVPADGSVEGWRFGLAGQVSDIKPSVDPDFESICAGTERQDGAKRVGVVIDPGTVDESPDGEQPGVDAASGVSDSPDEPPTQETSPGTPLAAALTVSVIAVVGFALWRRSRQAATL